MRNSKLTKLLTHHLRGSSTERYLNTGAEITEEMFQSLAEMLTDIFVGLIIAQETQDPTGDKVNLGI